MADPMMYAEDPVRPLRDLLAAGRFQEVLEAHRAAGTAAGQGPGLRQRPEVQLITATAATRMGDLGLAVSLAESALERFRARADGDGRMRAVNLLGAIAFEHGQLEQAERAFGEALDLARQLDDSLLAARASNNLASVAHLRGDAEVALHLYRSALLSYQRLGDRRGTSETYHNLGLTFRQLAEWSHAESAALQAVRHAEQVGERSLMALAIMGRAEIELDRGELELAQQELARAARYAGEADDALGGAEVGRLRALLALKQGADHLAWRKAEDARAVAERLGSVLLQGECAAVAAKALRALGREEDATLRHDEALAIFRRLGAVKLQEEFLRSWEVSDRR